MSVFIADELKQICRPEKSHPLKGKLDLERKLSEQDLSRESVQLLWTEGQIDGCVCI